MPGIAPENQMRLSSPSLNRHRVRTMMYARTEKRSGLPMPDAVATISVVRRPV